MCLVWKVEGVVDDPTETDNLMPNCVVFSLNEGRIKAGVVKLDGVTSPLRSCAVSDEESPLEE